LGVDVVAQLEQMVLILGAVAEDQGVILALLAVVVLVEALAVYTAAVALAAMAVVDLVLEVALELMEPFVSSIQAQLVASPQLVQVIYNGSIIYQGSRRSTSGQPSLREQSYSGLRLRAA
jgi:hypothetical protein